jgi:hypothetical protein
MFAQLSPEDQSAVMEPLLEMGVPKHVLTQMYSPQAPTLDPNEAARLASLYPPEGRGEALAAFAPQVPELGNVELPTIEPEADIIPPDTMLRYSQIYTDETLGEFAEKYNSGDVAGAYKVKLELRPTSRGPGGLREEKARIADMKMQNGVLPEDDEMIAYMEVLGVNSGAITPNSILNAKINLSGFANTIGVLRGPEKAQEFMDRSDEILKETVDETQKIIRGEAVLPTGETLEFDQGTSQGGLMKVLRIRTAVTALGPVPGPATPEVVQTAVRELQALGFTKPEIKAAMAKAWNIEPE